MIGWLKRMLGVTQLQAALEQREREFAELKALHEEMLRAPPPTTEPPRVELVSQGIRPDGSVSIELDWNDTFIKQLRDAGYEGDEEDMVSGWLTSLFSARADMVRNGVDDLRRERQGFISNE